ncbi:hypothetical protein ACSSS7_000506 [Eimeria intestinalis]
MLEPAEHLGVLEEEPMKIPEEPRVDATGPRECALRSGRSSGKAGEGPSSFSRNV